VNPAAGSPAAFSRLRTADGLELATEHHAVPGGRGRVVIVHGYAEHKGRYRHLVEILVAAGYSCHLLDLRGHGESGGRRGHVSKFEDYRRDLTRFLDEVRARGAASSPLLLLGHSLGGLIALDFVLHHPQAFDSLAVSSPFLAPALAIPFFKRKVLPLAANLVPKLAVESGLDPKGLSHDAEIVDAYEADPKVFPTVTLGWFSEVQEAQEEVFAKASAIVSPILVLLGGADPIADPDRSRAFFDRLGSASKHLVVYAGFFHEVLNELGRAQVVSDLLAWLDERTAPP
jgi:alpha-beta hydrolase superfamily lysophospholipase